MNINIELIRIDGGTQSRVSIDEHVVTEYASAMRLVEFPPVTVHHDGADYWLSDGFHRYHASRRAGFKEINVNIVKGTLRDSILHSLSANITHGLRRSNADKRKSVATMLTDNEWQAWPLQEIADWLQVDIKTVKSVLSELENKNTVETKHYEPKLKSSSGSPEILRKDNTEPAQEKPSLDGFYEPPSASELADAQAAHSEIVEVVQKILADGGEIADALKEVEKLRYENKLLNERIAGLMNERNELIRQVKGLQAKLKAMEKW